MYGYIPPPTEEEPIPPLAVSPLATPLRPCTSAKVHDDKAGDSGFGSWLCTLNKEQTEEFGQYGLLVLQDTRLPSR
jgi:hypothetical protein